MPRKRGKGTKKGRKPHRGIYHPPDQAVGAADPDSIWNHMRRFTQWQEEHHYSHHTIETRERTLRVFAVWAAERGLIRVQEITKPILERWQRHLFLYRKADGEPLAVRSQIAHIHPIKAFFRWLARQNHILYNPASELEMPRIGRRLPKHVMTIAEAEKVLSMPNLRLAMGVRDRAMLETLYSTGVRRQELVDLNMYDIDKDRGVLMVRQGKGDKDRIIPIGARALAWIDKYLDDIRPDLASGADDGTLFLSHTGQPLGVERLAEIVRECVVDSGIGKRGSCHMLGNTIGNMAADAVAGNGETSMARLRRQGGVELAGDLPEGQLADIIVTARRQVDTIKKRGFLDWFDGVFNTNLGGDNPHTKSSSSGAASSGIRFNISLSQSFGSSSTQQMRSYNPSAYNDLKTAFFNKTSSGFALRDAAYQDFGIDPRLGAVKYIASVGLRTLQTAELGVDLLVSLGRGHGLTPSLIDQQDAGVLSFAAGGLRASAFAAERMVVGEAGTALQTYWPPNRGFQGAPIAEELSVGARIDRYGHDGGTFLSPEGTPDWMRSLAPGTTAKPYNVYEVVNTIEVQSGKAAPWFNQVGGGTQYDLPMSVSDAIAKGHLRRVGP